MCIKFNKDLSKDNTEQFFFTLEYMADIILGNLGNVNELLKNHNIECNQSYPGSE